MFYKCFTSRCHSVSVTLSGIKMLRCMTQLLLRLNDYTVKVPYRVNPLPLKSAVYVHAPFPSKVHYSRVSSINLKSY